MKRLFIAVLMILSVTAAFTQTITMAEYFFDTDPGPGNGMSIPVNAPGTVVTLPVAIPVNLSPGFHWLGIRVKDSDGKWGLFARRNFYIAPTTSDLPILTQAEYFFDTDPGVGNGLPLTLQSPGFSFSQTFPIPVPVTMTAGTHRLAIRVKDQAGHWGLYHKDTIVVGGSATVSCPANVAVTASPGQCSAVVNSIDPAVSPQGSAFTYTLTGATSGTGTGTASGKTFNAGVTTVTYKLTNAPTISCSFTVTVNSNVVPSVTISANKTSICTGGTIVFTATPTNGGNSPHYQWKLNGNNVGTDSVILQTNQLNNGDVISVVMSSSIGCANPASGTSNSIPVTVTPPYITPTINITASSTSICPGTPVTFIAHSTNGGSPGYSWFVNNVWVPGIDSDTFRISTLANGDKVKCVMTSSLACVTDVTTISNEITMSVGNPTSSVTIAASNTSICTGQLVTFTATPTNGGTNPQYEWTVNGNAVNMVSTPTYQSSTLLNGDVVRVTMSPFGGCTGTAPVFSNSITMTVGSSVVPSVTIGASATNICAGTPVTFTASPVNQGSSPGYQWKLNGNNIAGATGNTYQASSLSNGDQIKLAMVSSLSCANPKDVVSNTITMSVGSGTTPSVAINASSTNFCYGTLVTFTATPTNGGNPTYQWKVNGNNVGATTSQWQVDGLLNGDTVTCVMTSNACGTPQNVTSNKIIVTVQSPVAPAVHIISERNPICIGGTARFTANPTNGGDHPSYQWKLNGVNVGSDSSGFSYNTVQPGDWIQALMTSSLGCVQAATVESNSIEMRVDSIRTYYRDNDSDGYGNPDSTLRACRMNENSGWVVYGGDCNDSNSTIHPNATERCGNGIDDDCDGQIDENCSAGLPVLILKTYPVREGDAGLTTIDVEVKLDQPAVSPVSINYSTSNANATAGLDYIAANGVVTIPAGAVNGTIQLKIIGDVLREDNEIFWLSFTNPVNAVLPEDPRSRIMIIDDDKGKPNSTSLIKEQREETVLFKIPTVAKRNTVWMIPQIGNYENEVMILNVQGQVVNRFINYKNQTSVGNLASGLYFYRIRITERGSTDKYYSGRLLITE